MHGSGINGVIDKVMQTIIKPLNAGVTPLNFFLIHRVLLPLFYPLRDCLTTLLLD
jgi:hypothetical protein